jgi:hypothetical protein
MKTIFLFVLLGFVFSFLKAQQLPPGTNFGYDASGNRTSRKTIVLPSQSAPMAKSSASKSSRTNSSLNEEDDFTPNSEDNLSVFGAMGTPENNDNLDLFYTDKLNESDVVIYPNPTKGALAVEIRNKNSEISHQLTVYNLKGSVIFQKHHIGDYTPIDLSSQPKGIYLLRVFSQNSFITWKIIKE